MWHTADLGGVFVACWCLDDEERRDGLADRQRALDAALFTNWAFASPKNLDQARRALNDELDTDPHAVADSASVIAAVHEHLARMRAQAPV